MLAILGWIALALIVVGLAFVVLGYTDMSGKSGDAVYGGAMASMLGFVILALGAILGLIWLVIAAAT